VHYTNLFRLVDNKMSVRNIWLDYYAIQSP